MYPNMYSAYGCCTLLKIVVKKKIISLNALPEFTMLQIRVVVSTLHVGLSVMSRSNQ